MTARRNNVTRPGLTVPPRLGRRSLLKGAAGLGLGASALGGLPVRSSARVARAQADPKTLTIPATPNDFDPHSQYDYNSVVAVRGMYEGLIALKGSSTNEYEGLIAESWEANDDKSVWTFHLRDGVTFQDGSPCDAAAVVASYTRLLTMQKGAWNVVGRFVEVPAQITAPDPRTVVFDLKQPQPLFEAAMAATYGPQVVNVKVAMEHEEDGDQGNAWMSTSPEGAGTGPYRLASFEPNTATVLEKYDGYWGGWEGDHFERIVIRVVDTPEVIRELVESGELDIINRFNLPPTDFIALESNTDLVTDWQPTSEVVYLPMTEYGPLASKEARQALSYAFPYPEVLEGFYEGKATQPRGLVAQTINGYNPDTFQYSTDLAKAEELLAAAGLDEGTELTLLIQATASNQLIGSLFQENLAQVGITLSIEAVDNATVIGSFYGDAPPEERPNIMLFNWWPDYNDAWNQLDPLVRCEPHGSANGGYYCNEEVDALLDTARDAATSEEYQEAVSRLQEILADDPAAIYMAEPTWVTVLQNDIQGWSFNPIYLGQVNFYRLSRVAS
jgi:peptide/nickel transport system substrate-binding protein